MPSGPHPDKTLCEEAGVVSVAEAERLFDRAITAGLVSEQTTADNQAPRRIWLVDGECVFEARDGNVSPRRYHGFPLRDTTAEYHEVLAAWKARGCNSSS